MSLRLYRFDISSVQIQTTIVRASSEQEARCLISMAATGDAMAQAEVSFSTRTLGGLREHPVQSISTQEHQYDIGYWEGQEVKLITADIELEFGGDHNHG